AGVPLFSNAAKNFYRLPSLLVTNSGVVLAASQKRFGGTDDFAPSSLVMRRSLDGGKTFEPEQTLFERSGYVTFNGNLVEDRQTSTIFACFIAFPHAERATWFQKTWIPNGGGFSMVKSTDDGRTWSAPIEVMPQPNAEGWRGGGAFNNNHGVQLQRGPHAGRLMICARVFKSGVFEGRAKGGLIYSDDHGQTWRVGGVVLKESGADNGEVAVCETANGEVYVNSRNQSGKTATRAAPASPGVKPQADIIPHRRIYSRSRDGGETFYEEGCHPELFDAPCNAGLTFCPLADNSRPFGNAASPLNDDSRSLQDKAKNKAGGGVLLFTAPAGPKAGDRSHLTGYLSRDGGRTWTRGAIISEKSGAYSDTAVTPDGTILTLYENYLDETKPKGLLLARYNLEWLLSIR
ncbi:MAG: sialidase family protein, partial [Candidatus Sumerlaeota bacterium]|nr:sialidase family protein [Candidatus Sumerlaeota bacterium]